MSIKLRDNLILLLGVIIICMGLCIGCASLPFAQPPKESPAHSFNSSSPDLINETSFADASSHINQTKTNLVYDYRFFPFFVLFVLFDVIGLPAIAICSASLFTKLISYEAQGFGQGI